MYIPITLCQIPDPVLLGEKFSSTHAPGAESGSINGLHKRVSNMSCSR